LLIGESVNHYTADCNKQETAFVHTKLALQIYSVNVLQLPKGIKGNYTKPTIANVHHTLCSCIKRGSDASGRMDADKGMETPSRLNEALRETNFDTEASSSQKPPLPERQISCGLAVSACKDIAADIGLSSEFSSTAVLLVE
jgi:hypothetical protein